MIDRVASPDDRRLDPYRHVGDPAWIRDQGLFVAEGRLVVERLLALDRFRIVSILVNPAAHEALSSLLAAAPADVLVCDEPTMTGITGHEFHRGCLALVTRPAATSADALGGARRLLALEGVGNPDNVGGLFRAAAAFDIGGVLLDRTTGDPFYRKAIRTSMGAVLRVPFARLDEWLPGLDRFQAAGFKLIALTPDRDAVPLTEFARTVGSHQRLIILAGAEGPGLARHTIERADARVRVAIASSLDSLNVVVAAAIALHAFAGDVA